MTLFMFVDR